MQLSEKQKIALGFAAGFITAVLLAKSGVVGNALAEGVGKPSIENVFADAPVGPPRAGPFVYFGVHGGLTMADTEISLSGVPVSFDGVGSKGVIGGVQVGVDYVLPSRLFAG